MTPFVLDGDSYTHVCIHLWRRHHSYCCRLNSAMQQRVRSRRRSLLTQGIFSVAKHVLTAHPAAAAAPCVLPAPTGDQQPGVWLRPATLPAPAPLGRSRYRSSAAPAGVQHAGNATIESQLHTLRDCTCGVLCSCIRTSLTRWKAAFVHGDRLYGC
jgi:hypothetical protein